MLLCQCRHATRPLTLPKSHEDVSVRPLGSRLDVALKMTTLSVLAVAGEEVKLAAWVLKLQFLPEEGVKRS